MSPGGLSWDLVAVFLPICRPKGFLGSSRCCFYQHSSLFEGSGVGGYALFLPTFIPLRGKRYGGHGLYLPTFIPLRGKRWWCGMFHLFYEHGTRPGEFSHFINLSAGQSRRLSLLFRNHNILSAKIRLIRVYLRPLPICRPKGFLGIWSLCSTHMSPGGLFGEFALRFSTNIHPSSREAVCGGVCIISTNIHPSSREKVWGYALFLQTFIPLRGKRW